METIKNLSRKILPDQNFNVTINLEPPQLPSPITEPLEIIKE